MTEMAWNLEFDGKYLTCGKVKWPITRFNINKPSEIYGKVAEYQQNPSIPTRTRHRSL